MNSSISTHPVSFSSSPCTSPALRWPRRLVHLFLALLTCLTFTGLAAAQPVTVRIVPQKEAVRPGEQFAIAVVLQHAVGFHTWPAAEVELPPAIADFAIRTEIKVADKPAWVEKIDGYQFPVAHPGKVPDPTGDKPTIDSPLYSDTAVTFIRVQVAQNAPAGEQKVTVKVAYQSCNDQTCAAPEDLEIEATVRVLAAGSTDQAKLIEPALFQTYDLALWGKGTTAAQPGTKVAKPIVFQIFGYTITIDPEGAGFILLLLLAALGGFLLNFTPCVLPVIPIKIMGLSASAGNPRRCLILGFIMALGVVAFWLIIGGLMASLTSFKSISALFQYPAFGIIVGLFMLGMAISSLGFFTVNLPNWVYSVNPKHDSAHGSFLFGIFTAVLSTPCTAPFMGAAAAWAVTQKPIISMATFAAIGVGMCLPYLILSANPKLLKRLPRTGPASELIKHVMGLLMIAVAIFFMGPPIAGWLQSPPNPPSRVYWWIVGFFGVLAGVWLVYKTIKITAKPGNRIAFGGIGLAIVAISASVGILLSSHGPIKWVYYTPQRFQDAVNDGNVVVVDFTAEWCLICKALESGVLHQPEIVKLLNNGPKVIPIKVDITGDNADGKAKLRELEWVGIPLLAIYGPGLKEPLKLDNYTPRQVLDAINQARGNKIAAGNGR